jgi:hypothetical protein
VRAGAGTGIAMRRGARARLRTERLAGGGRHENPRPASGAGAADRRACFGSAWCRSGFTPRWFVGIAA